ncbi:MAG: glycosyltransferase family 39 protein [Bacteroidales bacterium]|nr:glycosyltransferase family 39 protein [Bacteroidales bacterium]MCF8343078.1 glycosyltransferase family 39 protein [Bacteroidales bacterium]MCF8352048.1 glycosyltransferase family 39 protein [Bacteroidales bacterium]MCF8375340.1 glycosyltransferase family 39 protein [Bacteroidales bacterium]MCF8400196.1 glycosyltransferase family 39 protein [Bacteroidales bacterium]
MVELYRKYRVWLAMLIILVFAGYLRINSFWLPHVSGDEFHYVALGMKLDSCGLDGYNIKGVDYESFSLDGKSELTEIMLAPEADTGRLLKNMYARGRGYYDNALYNNSPALPFVIMLSQQSIGKSNGYFVSSTFIGKEIKRAKPETIFDAQFYLAIIPFVFSLMLILFTFFLGRQFFGNTTGLIAALLMAVNPVEIFVAHKIWADGMSAVFVVLSALFFLKGYKSKSWLLPVLSGLAAGIAYLFKQTAGFYVIGVMLFYILHNYKSFTTAKGLLRFFTNRFMLLFVGVFILATLFWLLKNMEVYGSPVYKYFPKTGVLDSFFQIKSQRPPAIFLFVLGVLFLSPLLALAWLNLVKYFRKFKNPTYQWQFLFMACWIFTYLIFLAVVFNAKEHRYFLPAYPAIAVLSAYILTLFRNWLDQLTKNIRWIGGNEIVFIMLVISARWSIPLVMDEVYQAGVLLLRPF